MTIVACAEVLKFLLPEGKQAKTKGKTKQQMLAFCSQCVPMLLTHFSPTCLRFSAMHQTADLKHNQHVSGLCADFAVSTPHVFLTLTFLWFSCWQKQQPKTSRPFKKPLIFLQGWLQRHSLHFILTDNSSFKSQCAGLKNQNSCCATGLKESRE